MSILQSEIKFFLSGGASNSNPDLSLGGVKSSVEAAATIFDKVTGAESAAGDVEYRLIYVRNLNGSVTLESAYLWLLSNTPSVNTTIAVGVGSSALNGTEQTVADENTAPTGITFLPAVNKAGGTFLGDIPAGQSRAVWLRRTVTAGASVTASDPFTLRVEGDTA